MDGLADPLHGWPTRSVFTGCWAYAIILVDSFEEDLEKYWCRLDQGKIIPG